MHNSHKPFAINYHSVLDLACCVHYASSWLYQPWQQRGQLELEGGSPQRQPGTPCNLREPRPHHRQPQSSANTHIYRGDSSCGRPQA